MDLAPRTTHNFSGGLQQLHATQQSSQKSAWLLDRTDTFLARLEVVEKREHYVAEAAKDAAERAPAPAAAGAEDYKEWKCGCGEVVLKLQGDPYFNLDCHCSACTPLAKYLDNKGGGGISALVNGTGVAKAFYFLDRLSFVKGKDRIAGVKLGKDGRNVRAYASCCNTLVIGDSPVPFAFRPLNRAAIRNADGSPYVPAELVWGCKGGGNVWYDAIPEPKHEGEYASASRTTDLHPL